MSGVTFEERLSETIALLRRHGRVSYRALKRQFEIDDEYLADLKAELVEVRQLAVDQEGKMLVWVGDSGQEPAGHEPAASARSSAADAPAPAERRQLSVMFCDLVDSTALSAELDPEDLREVLGRYHETTASVIERFGGFIAQYLGDGVLAYFGYPQAHENDAERAVLSGLGILEAMDELKFRTPGGRRLAVRVGIHTGPVVVGDVGGGKRHEHLALGETPNVAARTQALAAPDTVLVTAATWRLVQGYFSFEEQGPKMLRGLQQAVTVYRALAESGARSRLETAAPGALTPVVGREAEVKLLAERWARSRDGLGQVVLLGGEPGIGKSRLVELLREQIVGDRSLRITFRCSPYFSNRALHPVIEHLERILEFQRSDTAETKLAKLERMLSGYRFAGDKTISMLAGFLSIPLPEGRSAPLQLSPQQLKQQTAEALTAWLMEEADRRPVLAVCEDLHWADPSMVELLTFLLDQTPTARMLLVLTFRPEFHPPWAARSHVTQLTLGRFSQVHAQAMIQRALHGKALPPEVVQAVIAKTDGVPLFIEELLKMIVESGLLREDDGRYILTGPLPALAIPTTLQDSLMARLDRLAAAREVAQLGAALGREFSDELIRAVAPMDQAALEDGLAQLVEAEMIYRRGRPPSVTYLFKHALIRDAAYQTLLKSRRHFYHERIARVIEERFPDIKDTQPDLLAYHYAEAGHPEEAIGYRQRAAQQALQRSANAEGINHLTIALELLGTLPETPRRDQKELSLQTILGPALTTTKGFGAPEVERAYGRARALCQIVGDTSQLARTLNGLWSFYLVRGDYKTARELAEQMLVVAEEVKAPLRLLEAHRALGNTLLYPGELIAGRSHLEQALALYDPGQHRVLALRYGIDLAVSTLGCTSWGLWLLGLPDLALKRCQEMLAIAESLAHPYSQAWALTFTAWVHQYRREADLAQARAEAAIALATEHGFSLFLAMAKKFHGWALAAQGRPEEGIAELREGITAYQATGAGSSQTYWLALLAEAYKAAGRNREGLEALGEARAVGERSGERYYEAEVDRLTGELLASGGSAQPLEQAETCFGRALEVARSQSAKSLELRAAMSLGRLWQRQGKPAVARELLGPVYSSFTEGHDTADLKEARALLETLA